MDSGLYRDSIRSGYCVRILLLSAALTCEKYGCACETPAQQHVSIPNNNNKITYDINQ